MEVRESLEGITLNTVLTIERRETKEGKEYYVAVLYFEEKTTGELVALTEFYAKKPMIEILEYIKKTNK